jgi:uncharacterized protein (DUF58 family)
MDGGQAAGRSPARRLPHALPRPGLDLADLREYQYHDDVRHIDWNVTARQQTPYVRDFHEDRDVNAWFLLDLSPSIDFGSGAATKRSVSIEFVAVMARMLTRMATGSARSSTATRSIG